MTARVRAPLLAAAVPLAAFAFVAQVGNSRIAQAQAALEDGDYARAAERAESARAWAPWSAEPFRVLGTVAIDGGRDREAAEWLADAVEREPARWDLWWLLAGVSDEDGRRAAGEVRRLNPRADVIPALDEGSP